MKLEKQQVRMIGRYKVVTIFGVFKKNWSDFSYISFFGYFQTISPTYKLAHILLRSKCINNTSFLYDLHISGNIGTPMLLTCKLVSYIIN
jgi:hypothetical protein